MSASRISGSRSWTFGWSMWPNRGGDVDDPVVLVAQVVDCDPLGGRDVRHGHGLDGEDEDVLVEDLVLFHVCPTLRPLWYLSTL